MVLTMIVIHLFILSIVILLSRFPTSNGCTNAYYTSTKSWRGYIFTSVCLCVFVCVCVCVCPTLLVNKIPAERMHRFGRGFRLTVAQHIGSDLIEIGDLGSKVKVTVAQYPFFLHNSLLTSLLYISALICLIKLKFGMPL